jgi:signal transduction histidine kinase
VTIRGRLIATSLVTLAIGLGALIVIGNVLLSARTKADMTSLLEGRAQAQIAALEVDAHGITDREAPNDQTLDRQSWVLDGDIVKERPAGVSRSLDQVAVALGRTRKVGERDAPGRIRLLTSPVTAAQGRAAVGSVVVGVAAAPFDRLRREVLFGSLILAALVLVAGWLAIRSAVGGVLAPVAQMTESAESWGAHDLDRRFDLGPPTDELSGLAATLDRLLARIAASRRHEQRFASDVAHELRSPLAALQARTELALGSSGKGTQAERESALRSIAIAASRIEATIETLLAVARKEIDPSLDSVNVIDLADEIPDIDVLHAERVPRAEGDTEIVRRALSPLIENARRHSKARVWLEISATEGLVRIEVHDDGQGVDRKLGDTVFEPGVRGPGAPDDGAGLGLALSRRLARACGGDVLIGPGPHGCFVLELPAIRSDMA